jgi:hypothetical protein
MTVKVAVQRAGATRSALVVNHHVAILQHIAENFEDQTEPAGRLSNTGPAGDVDPRGRIAAVGCAANLDKFDVEFASRRIVEVLRNFDVSAAGIWLDGLARVLMDRGHLSNHGRR